MCIRDRVSTQSTWASKDSVATNVSDASMLNGIEHVFAKRSVVNSKNTATSSYTHSTKTSFNSTGNDDDKESKEPESTPVLKRMRKSSTEVDLNAHESKGNNMSSEAYSKSRTRASGGKDGYTKDEWSKIVRTKREYVSDMALLNGIRAGVPDDLRPDIWAFIGNVRMHMSKHTLDVYDKLKDLPSNFDAIIDLDTNRTFATDEFFTNESYRAKESLFNVLRAYANYDKEIGYTQGMNFVVAAILRNLHPEMNKDCCRQGIFQMINYEELAFWLFVHINHDLNWREVYRSGTPKAIQLVRSLSLKIRDSLPEVYIHITKRDLSILTCFTQFFVTILLYNTPLEHSARILDMFLIASENFIVDCLVRLLSIGRDEILKKRDTQSLFEYFKTGLIAQNFGTYQTNMNAFIPFTKIDNAEPIDLTQIQLSNCTSNSQNDIIILRLEEFSRSEYLIQNLAA
eukprot:TRINITY_DN5335_c0_g2_i2.p1 TRINITY_DN5335_c0_g2~~TRINITY_DN5335_c0_g2_i2.p1  ORF type:complete len:478 (+),score=93.14 TRINITY_DN5335_c0_g2_i2:66-1436(+)